jgi:titin
MAKQSLFARARLRRRRDKQQLHEAVRWLRFSVAEKLEKRVLLSTTFLVTNTADSGSGSLRQAITNADSTSGSSVIDFAIGSGPQTITPLSPLPSLNATITIDGTSQPGYAGTPLITLNGSSAGSSANGIQTSASGCSILGLVIDDFASNGIVLGVYGGTGGDTVEGCYIGIDPTGSVAAANGDSGILVTSSDNVIGGAATGAGNLISGNADQGVNIYGSSATGNAVEGNFVGTNAAGTAAIPNAVSGVCVFAANSNTIGGTAAGDGNLISGNTQDGVVTGGSTTGDVIEGNLIGTDVTGTLAIPNDFYGIELDSGSTTIGGLTPAARNIISGNFYAGVVLFQSPSVNNLVEGNYIGPDITGTQILGAQPDGVDIDNGAADNTVGGTTAAARNVISGNVNSGVGFFGAGTTGNVVEGNYIGTTASGMAGLGNGLLEPGGAGPGVLSDNSASGNLIGGNAAGDANLISANGAGIVLFGNGDTAEGNLIGANASGVGSLANASYGILIDSNNNIVGGPVSADANQIFGNTANAINVAGGSGNVVEGNIVSPPASNAPTVTLTAPASGSSTSNTTPTFSGVAATVTGDSPVTVNLYTGSTASGTPVETLTAAWNPSTGAWSVPASAVLPNGTYTAQATQTDATSDVGASGADTFTIAPAPAPGTLADADIGSPTDAGSATYNSTTGVWTVAGGGSDIWGNSDQFNFASTTVSGNATLITEVTSLTNTDPWAKAGLMFRDGSTSNAANVAVFATAGNGVSLQWRTTAGGASNYTNIASVPVPTGSAPIWLELVRTGNVFNASYSTNGTTYTTVGTVAITLDTALSAGLAVTAHNNSLLTTATFANVAVPYVAGPVAIPAVPSLSASPATGAVSLSWSPVAGATTYDLYRSTTSGEEGPTPYLTGLVGMAYTDTNVTAQFPYYYTLTAVNSAGQSSQSTETSATPTAATSTSALSDADIGSPADPGSASFNSSTGVWTIAGGGADVWGNSDQFNFASTTISGNATLITEVTSLTNTDPWGKAGLMFRDGSTSNAANVAVFATAGNGVSFQWRTTAGGTSSYTNIATVPIPTASAPIWLELVRTGNVFTASYSTNGTTYTTVGTVTITLDTALSAGLAVTAHNNSMLATATFANVAVPYVAGPVAIPAAPSLSAAPAAGAVSLSWSPVSGAAAYDLYRSTTSDGEGSTPYLTGLSGPTYSDTNVTAGTPYYYTLSAVNSVGAQSSQSTETSATPTAAVAPVTAALADADIGSPTDAGSASYNSTTGVWTVAGGGSDIWGNSDQFNFAATTLSGNATLITELTSLTNTDPWAKAGLMFRDGSAANAANVAVFATPGNGVSLQWRSTAGGNSNYANIGSVPAPTTSVPIWLELVRNGNVFTASYSTNGTTYTTVGTVTITLDTALSAGLAVTAHNNSLLATATFANVAVPYVAGPVAIPAVPSLAAAPATGAVSLSWSPVAGATSYDLYRSTTTGGEGATPYLTGLVGMAYTDTNVTAAVPYYYTLTAVNSAGGQSSQSTEATATPTASTSTSALSDADIGSPADPGSASFNSSSGVWTIAGGGSDIWGNSDQFNFASTSISGNATLIAEVTSLTNTNAWAKAGLMFRDGSAANAANVAVFATPGNGVSLQWRTTAGGVSNYTNIGSIPAPTTSAPIWLELVRNGNVFTASYSTNGTTYTTVGTVTVTLDTALSAGLAVTAHNNNSLAAATFANVNV